MIITLGDSNAARVATMVSALDMCQCQILYLGPGAPGGNAWQIFVRIPRHETQETIMRAINAKLNSAAKAKAAPPEQQLNTEAQRAQSKT